MTSKKGKKVVTEDEKLRARVEFVNGLSETEGYYDSPIDVDIKNTTPIILPRLAWFNYEFPPKKMKVTNTGHTVILSAKWFEERPFLSQGPMLSTYVFNQMHFHWGPSGADGSEHTVESKNYPLEMHVVHFKSSYATQDIALREKDGMIVLIFFFKLQSTNNPALDEMIKGLPYVSAPHTSVQISPFALTEMMPTFAEDYLIYWGCVNAVTCKHRVMWLVGRETLGISSAQMEKFRMLMSTTGDPLPKHVRKINASPRTVFHVNGGDTPTTTTLLPILIGKRRHISMPGPGYRRALAAAAKGNPPPPDPSGDVPPTFYTGDNVTGQTVPVYAMDNGRFKMPFVGSSVRSSMGSVGEMPASKSVTFEEKQKRLQEEEEVERKMRAEEEKKMRAEVEQRRQQERQAEENRERERERQAKSEKDTREADLELRQEQERQLREAKREREAKARQQIQMERERVARNEKEMMRQAEKEPMEVFHAATQKPSIGFKLRRPLVEHMRKLDMATQAPSMSEVYRPANALSTATVLGDEERWGLGQSTTGLRPGEEDDSPRSATVLPDEGGWGSDARSATVMPATVSKTSTISFAPAVVVLDVPPSVTAGAKPTVTPSVKPSHTPTIAPGEDPMGQRDDFSTLSCFDTKDYHMTPKGSLAPTASIRRTEEELEVYNTTFREVGPLLSERKTPSKK